MKITGGDITVEFHSPEIDSTGWLKHYSLSLSGLTMSSTIRVSNPPYGDSPSDFFSMLASNWKGWAGAKNWGALEGEYYLTATADSTGHVSLSVKICSTSLKLPCWTTEVTLIIEAGELEFIANELDSFLNTNS